MKNSRILLACLVLPALLAYCGGGSKSGAGNSTNYPRYSADNKTLIEFNFPASKNPSLSLNADVTGIIKDNTISLEVPYAAPVTSLVAQFITNSQSVEVNGVVQQSGVTANDFTNPVIYSVKDDNGDKQDYTVTVARAQNTEKKILSYSISGTIGTIDEAAGTISVVMPPRSSVSETAASFSAVGKSITVNGIAQESGVTKQNFSSPVVYAVTADNNSTRSYTVTVTVLPAPWNEITSFSFRNTENASLVSDAAGLISGSEIQVVIPYNVKAEDLVAYFITEAKSVFVGAVTQQPGITHNNFTGPVIYTAIAENGDAHEYTVTVTAAKSDAAIMTAFSLDGENGIIDEAAKKITVTFPSTKNITGLIAAFTITGVSVKVNGVLQITGETANNFSSPVLYDVAADNGNVRTYTVEAVKSGEMAGLWNFDYASEGGYTVTGATQVQGISGSALLFDGYTNYVSVPNSGTLTLANGGSIEVVLKAVSHRPYAGIVHKGVKPDFSDESYSLQFWGNNGTDGTVRFSVFNNKNVYSYVDSNTKLATGIWYHIVATWNTSGLCIYINGAIDNSLQANVGNVRKSQGDLIIGAQLNSQLSTYFGNVGFNGVIDRVLIFNSTLSDTEVMDHYKDFAAAGGTAITAYLLSAASRNMPFIFGILGCIVLVLVVLFIYNKKREGVVD